MPSIVRRSSSVVLGAIASLLVASGTGLVAQGQLVRVTVPKANVRSEPSEKAPILQQVTPLDQIDLRAIEGAWFKVLLPPNAALGGARVEAYISKKVAKVVEAKSDAMPAAATPDPGAPAAAAAPKVDTHAANVFLGSGVGGTLLPRVTVRVVPNGNRQAWTIERGADWPIAADRRPSFVVSIGDQAGFSPAGLEPSAVKLAAAPAGLEGLLIGSTRGDRDWKADDIALDMSEGAAGLWNVTASKDLKPGDYAIVLRPSKSNVMMPEIAWVFTIK